LKVTEGALLFEGAKHNGKLFILTYTYVTVGPKWRNLTDFPRSRIDEFFIKLAKFESLFTFQIRSSIFSRKSFNILAILDPTKLASLSKGAQIIELSYNWIFEPYVA
jgi:hypothetical protein